MQAFNLYTISKTWAVQNTENAVAKYAQSESFQSVLAQVYATIRDACDRGEPAAVIKLNPVIVKENLSPVLLSVALRRELTSRGYKVDFNTNRKKKADLQMLVIWGYADHENSEED